MKWSASETLPALRWMRQALEAIDQLSRELGSREAIIVEVDENLVRVEALDEWIKTQGLPDPPMPIKKRLSEGEPYLIVVHNGEAYVVGDGEVFEFVQARRKNIR